MRDKDHSNDPAYMAFAARLRQAVKRSGMSQTRVADLANITEVSMSRYMAGQRIPNPIILARICEVIRCDANWLIGKKITTKWIPVEECLPNICQRVFITCKADGRKNWVADTVYIPLSKIAKEKAVYSDWGNIPILNNGRAEVIAWMPFDYPEPWEEEERKNNGDVGRGNKEDYEQYEDIFE